ncbi:MAG: type VI secretion system protein TssA [Planctomycetes bacterium]|nr:type VI secretion system protein TssA [Planctomycetota bacterium]
MGSPAVLDFEALLAPIAGEKATGADLRQDVSSSAEYYRIKDARSAARASERQGEFGSVIGMAEAQVWRPIIEDASHALAQRTKDLEIVAWLIEALVRAEGFAGLRDGLRLARELVERYWDGLYPTPDEDGVATKVSPIAGLNGSGAEGTLVAPLARIPITEGKSVEPFSLWTVRAAMGVEKLPAKEKEAKLKEGALGMEAVAKAVRETSPAFLVSLIADIEEAQLELKALGAKLDACCGADSPPSSAIGDALGSARDMVRDIAREVLASAAAQGAKAADAAASSAAAAEASASVGGAAVVAAPSAPVIQTEIQSREDAFRLVELVAEYFRAHEPHTPITLLLERASRWGRMTLPELLAELIPNDAARITFSQMTGIEFPKPQK